MANGIGLLSHPERQIFGPAKYWKVLKSFSRSAWFACAEQHQPVPLPRTLSPPAWMLLYSAWWGALASLGMMCFQERDSPWARAQRHGMNMAYAMDELTCHWDCRKGEKLSLRSFPLATWQKSVIQFESSGVWPLPKSPHWVSPQTLYPCERSASRWHSRSPSLQKQEMRYLLADPKKYHHAHRKWPREPPDLVRAREKGKDLPSRASARLMHKSHDLNEGVVARSSLKKASCTWSSLMGRTSQYLHSPLNARAACSYHNHSKQR